MCLSIGEEQQIIAQKPSALFASSFSPQIPVTLIPAPEARDDAPSCWSVQQDPLLAVLYFCVLSGNRWPVEAYRAGLERGATGIAAVLAHAQLRWNDLRWKHLLGRRSDLPTHSPSAAAAGV